MSDYIPKVYPQDILDTNGHYYREGGMTLLDFFAREAMSAFITNSKPEGGINVAQLTDNAYLVAAWMCATRTAAHEGYPAVVAMREKLIKEQKEAQEKAAQATPLVVVS